MERKLEQIREQLPAVQHQIYLNAGTAGPMPTSVQTAMIRSVEAQVQRGRIGNEHWEELFGLKQQLRAAVAGMLGCSEREIALTQSTSDGMNLITMGVNWRPGDEAITTNLEHAGALLPLFSARERFGITVKIADVMNRPDQAADVIEGMITSRTKLISLSHVSYTTGAVLPVRAICEAAHRHGVLVLVDGAQSFAAMEVDVRQLGCDFYAAPGQKWICGPEGIGFLYVSQSALSQVLVTFAGYFTVEKFSLHGGMLPKDNAQRFEQGTAQPANFAGALAACRWHTDEVGSQWAYARIRRLAQLARESLANVPGIRVLTPAEAAGLVTFEVEGVAPEAAVKALREQGIIARTVPDPSAVRLATGFYNTEEEIERVVAAVAEGRI